MTTAESLIGENAGKIWKSMNGGGACVPSEIAKKSKLKAAEANQAIGWLAPEGKLEVEENGNHPKFRIKP